MTTKLLIAALLAAAMLAVGGVQMATAQRERPVRGSVVVKATGNAVTNATVTFEDPTRRKRQRATDSIREGSMPASTKLWASCTAGRRSSFVCPVGMTIACAARAISNVC